MEGFHHMEQSDQITGPPPNCSTAFVVVLNMDGSTAVFPTTNAPVLVPAAAPTMRSIEAAVKDVQSEVSRIQLVSAFIDATKTPNDVSTADRVAQAFARREGEDDKQYVDRVAAEMQASPTGHNPKDPA